MATSDLRSAGRSESADPLAVRVTGGLIRGVQDEARFVWRGIPYAAAPVGPLRLRAPQPVVPWSGIRDCASFGYISPQARFGQFVGESPDVPSSEDCLTVNVSAPTVPGGADGNRPVMVNIHGGGYSVGSSQGFAGEGAVFIDAGQIVYVSFNYRLGALGYLDFTRYSTPDRPFESNLGLRDQVAALQWVQANIGSFGGDPRNVTVFGESAGGTAVTTLMATPAAKGLFARAIAQSPLPNAVYPAELTSRWAGEFIEILRDRLAVPAAESAELPDASTLLAESSVADLTEAAVALQIRVPGTDPGAVCLAPVIDGDFLPEHPLTAFRNGRALRVPLIIGTNQREGTVLRGRSNILPSTSSRVKAVFARALESARTPMRRAYPGLPVGRAAIDFGGDYSFWYPSLKVAEFHSHYAPTYAYRFDVVPRLLRLLGLDATHGIEMYALFDQMGSAAVKAMGALGGSEQYSRAGARMRDFWIRFAWGADISGEWPPYTLAHRRTRIIAQTDRIESDPQAERRLAWEAFLPLGTPAPSPH